MQHKATHMHLHMYVHMYIHSWKINAATPCHAWAPWAPVPPTILVYNLQTIAQNLDPHPMGCVLDLRDCKTN